MVINANFYNEALEPITSPEIIFEITDEKGKKYESQFAVNGNGYQAKLGKMNPGKYTWITQQNLVIKSIPNKETFLLKTSIMKKANLLQIIVFSNSFKAVNGKFYNLNKLQTFYGDLSNRKDIKTVSYEEETTRNLIDLWWYLLITASFSYLNGS